MTFGILTVLLLSLGLTSAHYASDNNVTLTTYVNSLTNVSAGETYNFNATVENLNGTAFYIVFGTAGWNWYGDNVTLLSGESANFTGTMTIPFSAGSKSIIANFYNASNHSESLFQLSKPINLEYYTAEISGCTNSTATNYNSSATVDDGSCVYPISIHTYCKKEGYREHGNLEIRDFNVNNRGEGRDDKWQYLDNVEITVEVENNNNDNNINDVEVRLLILDDKIENGGRDVTNDFNLNDKIQDNIGRLRSGDKEKAVFKIDELPADIESGTYYMYIMTYERGNEGNQCTSDIDGDNYFRFIVEPVDYDKSIVVRGSELNSQMNTYCGQRRLEVSVPVYNLGDNSEEKVLVNLYNSKLGIDDYEVINNLNNGDKEVVKFYINIPTELNQTKYDLSAITNFDWDSSEDYNDASSYREENSDTSIRLNILNCQSTPPSVAVSLESVAEVGQNLIIKATIKNNAAVNDFTITPIGFESWANLISVSPKTSSIASKGSQDVVITLSPKLSGAQSFTISTKSEGETYTQQVSVNIAEQPGIFSSLHLSGTSLYLLIGITSLLALIFLMLIVRVIQRPPRRTY